MTGGLAWQDDAACRGTDPELWFPSRGDSTTQQKAICAGCPVRAQCLEHAIVNVESFGIWGGTSERERRRIRAARRTKTRRSSGWSHGTTYGYQRGCRCDACTATNSERQKRYRQGRALRSL